MKSLLIFSLSLLFSGLLIQANAQTTAVMQAKVQVVSGAGFTTLDEKLIDFSSLKTLEDFEAGSFSLVASPGSEVNVHVKNDSPIINEKGESLKLISIDADRILSGQGEHKVSVHGKISDLQNLNGHYKGAITAVVEYL